MNPPPLPPQRPAQARPVEVRQVGSAGSAGSAGSTGSGGPGGSGGQVRPIKPVKRGPRATWFRLAMLVVCLASIGLVYWSFFLRFLPVSSEHEADITELSRLSDEVEQLQLRLDPVEAEQTRVRFEAARQLLFSDADALQQWGMTLERDALSRALDVNVVLGDAEEEAEEVTELSRVSAELTLWPMTVVGLTNSPYQRVLGYFQDVVTAPKRIDLLELRVDGNSNSVEYAHARFQVMSGHPEIVKGREVVH